jgi:hypothetical protein
MTKVAHEKQLPATARLVACGEADFVQLAGDEGKRRRGINILLYTGAPVARYGTKLVFDLSGMEVADRQLPVLFSHDPERPIGFSARKDVETTPKLRVKAELLDATKFEAQHPVREAIGLVEQAAEQGYRWQASMGVRMTEVRWLDEGETRECNGTDFKGPGYCVTKSQLLEASVLALGADGKTQSTVLELGEDAGDSVPVLLSTTRSKPNMDLKTFLAAFPANRRGWAAERFAEGKTSIAEVKAELADILLTENESLAKEKAEADAKLELVARDGHEGEAEFSGTDEQLEAGDGRVDLSEHTLLSFVGESGAELKATVNAQLEPEWKKLHAEERKAFGSLDAYRCFRLAQSAGKTRIFLPTDLGQMA